MSLGFGLASLILGLALLGMGAWWTQTRPVSCPLCGATDGTVPCTTCGYDPRHQTPESRVAMDRYLAHMATIDHVHRALEEDLDAIRDLWLQANESGEPPADRMAVIRWLDTLEAASPGLRRAVLDAQSTVS